MTNWLFASSGHLAWVSAPVCYRGSMWPTSETVTIIQKTSNNKVSFLVAQVWTCHIHKVDWKITLYCCLKYMFSFTAIKKENSSNIFLITYEEAMLLEFSSLISVKYAYNMFLGKIRQSYCYTKLCNYREEVAIKPISNISNILVYCNLSFTRFLTLFPPGGGHKVPTQRLISCPRGNFWYFS